MIYLVLPEKQLGSFISGCFVQINKYPNVNKYLFGVIFEICSLTRIEEEETLEK